MFEFRPLAADDFPLMLRWLTTEHIKKWWNDGDDTLEKVALHYGAKDDTVRFILLATEDNNKKPIGYFQYYFEMGGTIGIDQFIGEENYLNRGVGTRAIKVFVGMIARRHRPTRIVLDPSPENKRAIRCYEKVGFKHYQTTQNGDGSLAYMMQLKISPTDSKAKTEC
jgi:RimJ/RimL family protein N-acetyltransferase